MHTDQNRLKQIVLDISILDSLMAIRSYRIIALKPIKYQNTISMVVMFNCIYLPTAIRSNIIKSFFEKCTCMFIHIHKNYCKRHRSKIYFFTEDI